jgi:cytochrome c biogenesis protein ResB
MITLELWPDYRAFANLPITGRPTPMLVQFDPYIRYSIYVGRISDPSRTTIDTTGLQRVARGDLRAAGTARTAVPGAGELTLSFPELRQYTVLLISRDVGIPLVLAAAILVLVGLIPALYVSRRKVWIRAEAAPGGALVKIGGFALQRKDAFEEEFDRIVRAVGERVGEGGPERTPQGSHPPQEPHPEEVGTS